MTNERSLFIIWIGSRRRGGTYWKFKILSPKIEIKNSLQILSSLSSVKYSLEI
jgi:hypothetical protein